MVKVPPLAVPQLGSCASSGRAWRLWAARYSQTEARPLGAQPLPRVLEPAASKAADVTAFDHVGETLDFVEGLSTQGGLSFRVSWEAVAPYELRPGKMHVQVCCATDLLAADSNGLSDPYCKLTWLGQHGQSATLAVPEVGSRASSGRAWQLWPARRSQGRDRPTGRPATASGVRASRLRSRRFHRL